MRLTKKEIDQIKKVTSECFGQNAKVYLFGSRTDDKRKGGDIDLYIETGITKDVFARKLKMLADLEEFIGEQRIDIVINNHLNDKYIYHIAKFEGIPL